MGESQPLQSARWTIDDLSDEMNLLLGYTRGALTRPGWPPEPGMTKQDLDIATRLRDIVPALRAVIEIARSHPEECDARLPVRGVW